MKVEFRQGFAPLSVERIHDFAAERKRDGWRYVQTLAVNTEKGVDLVYSFMKDGVLDNKVVRDVPRDAVIPSITDLYLEAFVFENEIHDLFGVHISDTPTFATLSMPRSTITSRSFSASITT